MLKGLWTRLFGQGGGGAEDAGAAGEAVEYQGFRIRPAPYASEGQYQTAGIIEKDTPEGVKTHRFVRAEKHASREDAASFALTKARQIIDQQGDRIFEERKPG
jgi:hypothetical protein